MTPEDADALQRRYNAQRREWVSDPDNDLHPYPSEADDEAG